MQFRDIHFFVDLEVDLEVVDLEVVDLEVDFPEEDDVVPAWAMASS